MQGLRKLVFETYLNVTFRKILVTNRDIASCMFRLRATRSATDLERIESEYIKNLQQQVYFLELEANYLYPCRQM